MGTLLDRNAHLEEENCRLHRELLVLRAKASNGSPLSHHSESTDEGGLGSVFDGSPKL